MLSLAALLVLAGPVRGAEFVPVFNATLMGGQYFFKTDHTSLSGNASALAAPVIVQSDQWSFIPMLSSNYQGTKGVNDNVAAGTLFQEEMDHRLSFTAIDTVPNSLWKLKPSVSYKRDFLKETVDETWGHGLFDYDKMALGFEAENVYKDPFSYRLGFDVFKVRYMNYQSLESQSGTDPLGNPLGRENAGTNVLDSYNYQLSASVSRPFPYEEPKVSLHASYSILYQDYMNDAVVDARGQNKANTRKDFMQTVAVSAGYPRKTELWGTSCRVDSSVGLSLAVNSSNQNTFDAAQTRFIDNAYSFVQIGLGPGAVVSWGDDKRPASLGATVRWLRTAYTGRLSQDGDGLYLGDNQTQDRYQFSLNYGYPISPTFYLKAQANMLWARSNNLFEKTYAYNYTSNNFLMGVSWEY